MNPKWFSGSHRRPVGREEPTGTGGTPGEPKGIVPLASLYSLTCADYQSVGITRSSEPNSFATWVAGATRQSAQISVPETLRPVVTFAYITGWRVPSEVLPLEWRQVDLDAGTVRLDSGQTKNG